jgi:rhamnosyl/mannosyltransferase
VRRHAAELRNQYGEFVLFLGCLRAYKGLPYLLEAARLCPGRRFVIAGDGPMRPRLEQAIQEMRLGDRVTLLGRVGDREALDLLHAAAVFVLPAHLRSEAFGLCQIEAMACGLPVVSTDLPTGVPEVNRHGETGLIVPPADAPALAAAIRQLIENKPLRARLGAQGQARAHERYQAQRMAGDVAEVYRDVLKSS